MKRRDPHLPAVDSKQRLDTRAHFLRSLVGERDGKNPIRFVEVVADQVRNAMRDDARLPRAGAREYQNGTVRLEYCRPLLGIQGGEKIHSPLFYRYALGEIPRLIDITAATHG